MHRPRLAWGCCCCRGSDVDVRTGPERALTKPYHMGEVSVHAPHAAPVALLEGRGLPGQIEVVNRAGSCLKVDALIGDGVGDHDVVLGGEALLGVAVEEVDASSDLEVGLRDRLSRFGRQQFRKLLLVGHEGIGGGIEAGGTLGHGPARP